MSQKHGRAVLIVDSHESTRQSLAIWVEMTCCGVVEAENGEKAITFAREKAPKLILMDMYLPNIDGFEVAKQISSQRETSHIPIVAVAALGSEFNWREKAQRRR